MRWLLLLVACHGPSDPKAQAAFDRYRRPDELVAALHIRPGDAVADVGAGTGYLTHRLAAAAGARGRVVATDIDFAALQKIGAPHSGEAPIEIRRVPESDPSLEPGGYDLILLSEVDQYLPDRASYLGKLKAALKAGGRIAVCNRRLYRAPVLQAASQAGLVQRDEYDKLPAHFLLFFQP
jgi:2-polyprenyl-3-methyl-5-hydroxy-6-metoxy-1,4-benzoquinol methylase